MTTQATESGFFNLHTSGLGYLNRVRMVTPNGRGRKSEPFLACSIAGLHGAVDNPTYTYFDVRVVGEQAIELVECLEDAANDPNRKVLVVFNIGDIWADPFIYEKGQRKGEPGASIKGRLLKIRWAKVDDEVVYQAEDGQPETASQPEAADSMPDEREAEAPAQGRNVSRLSRPAREESRSRESDGAAQDRGASRFQRQPARDDLRSTRFARTGTGR